MAIETVALYYFSGTGNTALAAKLLAEALRRRGCEVRSERITWAVLQQPPAHIEADALVLAYPIHAFSAPWPVGALVDQLPPGNGRPALLLRTPGDPWLHGGATARIRRQLRQRGYQVTYDALVVMPANVLIAFPPRLVKQLYLHAGARAERVAEEFLAGREHLPREGLVARALTAIVGRLEARGARRLGRYLSISDDCTLCGRCVRECPLENITLVLDRIAIGTRCSACLHCVYTCPQRAIRAKPRWLRAGLLAEGYDIAPILADETIPGDWLGPDARGMWRRYAAYLQQE